MGRKIQVESLCNGYSQSKLCDIIYSHKNISDEEQVVLIAQICLFIGIEDKYTKHVVKENLVYNAHEIGYIIPD